jgi:hypothetical protein
VISSCTSVIYTRRVWFSPVKCHFQTHKCNLDTHVFFQHAACDFLTNQLKLSLITQLVFIAKTYAMMRSKDFLLSKIKKNKKTQQLQFFLFFFKLIWNGTTQKAVIFKILKDLTSMRVKSACIFLFSITRMLVKTARTVAHKSYSAACQIDTQIFTV